MKRFLLVLGLILLLGNTNYANAAGSVKSDIKEIKNILKSQIQAANKYSYQDFIKYFDFGYINSDGFGLDIYSKLVEDTWASYNNIQYAQKVKNITVNGKDAIAEVLETANARIESQYNLSGDLKSIANNVYFLKKTTNGWRIVSDVILTEDTYLAFGELSKHTPVLNVPYQIAANSNYTASIEFTAPPNTIAIASINQEKVSYPQQNSKENYRKLPDDGILERFFTSNGEGVNEYIVASIGLTRPEFENKDLQINVTGIAYIIKRVNVIPENKFINRDDVIPVREKLLKLQEEDKAVEKAKKEQQEAQKHEIKKNDSEKDSNPADVQNDKKEKQVIDVQKGEDVPAEIKDVQETSAPQQLEEKGLNLENPAPETEKVKSKEQNVAEIKEDKQPAEQQTPAVKSNDEQASADSLKKDKTKAKKEKVKTEKKKKDKTKGKAEQTDNVGAQNSAAAKDNKSNSSDVKTPEPGQKAEKVKNKKNKRDKQKKDKSLKGTYSPSTIGIPTTATVCPIEEPLSSENVTKQ